MSDSANLAPAAVPEAVPKKVKAAKSYQLVNTGAGPRPLMIGNETLEFGPYEAKPITEAQAQHPDTRSLVEQGYVALQEV
jgi:hypothetical protein